jgi:uncharacterized protein (DUF58 family)
MTSRAAQLHASAQEQAGHFPPLLARAQALAQSVLVGEHGRRRAGLGDDFWQYRPLRAGDSARDVDWRRSGRGDEQFIREREWKIAQSVQLWVDTGASMRFSSGKLPPKVDYAQELGLAAAILLLRGGERGGWAGGDLPPRAGQPQALRLCDKLLQETASDYATPMAQGLLPNGRALFISDYLGDLPQIQDALAQAADRGVRGLLIQLLDPAERALPYAGRTLFESMGGSLRHETLKASALRAQYAERLAERQAALDTLCTRTGWSFASFQTDTPARDVLIWIAQMMERHRA